MSRGARAQHFERRWLLAAAALTLMLFAAGFAKTGFGVFGDGVGYYAPLRSLVFDHDLRIDDELVRLGSSRWSLPTAIHSKFPIGLSLVLAPFFLLGHGLAFILGAATQHVVAADGYSWPYELCYCAGSVLLGIGGLGCCARAARAIASPWAALLAVLGVWFASPLFYYLALEPAMAHAVSQALVSWVLYATLTKDWVRDRRAALAVGLGLGLATLVRPQEGLFGLTIAVWALWPGRSPLAERGRALALVTVAALAVASLQLVVYRLEFGSLTKVPYFLEASAAGRGSTFTFGRPHLTQVLFSPFHGLFAWHPLMLPAVVGLAVLARRERRIAAGLAVGLAVQLWAVSAWHAWWQGASMGGRMFASSSFVFTLGLAALWDGARSRGARVLVIATTALCVLWNGMLAVEFRLGLVPGEAPVSLMRMVSAHAALFHRVTARVFGW